MRSTILAIASTAMLMLLAPLQANAISDCPSFTSSCSDACNAISKPSNASCTAFAAGCACNGAIAADGKPLSGADDYCKSMNSTCSQTVCAGAVIDSFSCDKFSFVSICQCRSGSNQNGGPMIGSNEQKCMDLMGNCTNVKCAGKKVMKNICTDPKTAVCQCEGEAESVGDGSSSASLIGAAGGLVSVVSVVAAMLAF